VNANRTKREVSYGHRAESVDLAFIGIRREPHLRFRPFSDDRKQLPEAKVSCFSTLTREEIAMNPPKGSLIGGFLLWLILLALSQSLHAEGECLKFGDQLVGSNDGWGFTVKQDGSGGAIRGWCESTNAKEYCAGVWGYGF